MASSLSARSVSRLSDQLTTPTWRSGLSHRHCQGSFIACCHSLPSAAQQQTGPDISQLSLELQSQWDHSRNAHLGPITITPGSHRKVHWICTQCPDGHPHRWQAIVQNRVNNRGCPFCSGHTVCPHNSLAGKAPQLAMEWDIAKNPDSPHDYTLQSSHRAHWICLQGHQWQAQIKQRVRSKTGCPICCKTRSRTALPVLTASTSHIMQLWDKERNRAAGLDPSKLTCGSNKTAHFTCDQCLLSHSHDWTTAIHNVVRGTGCPYCSSNSSKVCRCNSLQTRRPDLAAEWCYAMNEGTPDDYNSRSHKKVWWENVERGQWKESISSRSYIHPKPEVPTSFSVLQSV